MTARPFINDLNDKTPAFRRTTLKRRLLLSAVAAASGLTLATPAGAQEILRITESNFNADAGLITFSEFPGSTSNPIYTPDIYGGGAGAPTVTFDGWFVGQSLSLSPFVDCPEASPSACMVGTPTGPLTLDPLSPDTFITDDGAAPNTPVLSGAPRFNGPIAVLFSEDQAGVGFDAGFFDATGSTGITAFARDGTLLGTVVNEGTGIEFLGLVTADGLARIAGVFLDLVGAEPAGFAIDSLRFGLAGQITIPGLPPVGENFLYWDGDAEGNANNGAVNGGDGVWTALAAASNWTGADGAVNGPYAPNPTSVVFQGDPGTVTVDASEGAISVAGMTFDVDGYHIVGDSITLAAPTVNVKVGNGGETGASFVAQIDSVLTGTGALTKSDLGTLILTANNDYSGGTTVAAGTLSGIAGSFGSGDVLVQEAGTLNIGAATDATFANVLNGTGSFVKTGAATLTVSTGGDFSGSTLVSAGTLLVDGSIADSDTTVSGGATLGGNGTVGAVAALSESTIAPGTSIGTLTVDGPLTQAAGSTYAVELTSTGETDLLQVNGTATLESGARLVVSKLDEARYQLGRRYLVLDSEGLTGTYALSGDTNVSLFYNLVASYDANNAYLDVAQTRSFASAGATPNQIAAAAGADSLRTGTLHDAIGYLQTVPQAQAAFDSISGELHATARAVTFEDSRFIREAVFSKLEGTATERKGLWFHGYGSWGDMKGNGNAGRWERNIGGAFIGLDVLDDETLKMGVLGGFGQSKVKLPVRASSATLDDAHIGAYVGVGTKGINLHLGGTYTFRSVKTDRSASFPGFSDQLRGKYNLYVAQLFGEVSGSFGAGALSIEPLAGLAYVRIGGARATERGGPARLDIFGGDTDVLFTTLGARVKASLGSAIALTGSAAWRHAGQSDDAIANLRFQGGDLFQVAAPPIAKDVAALSLGIGGAISPGLSFNISYSGQIGSDLADHGGRASLRLAF